MSLTKYKIYDVVDAADLGNGDTFSYDGNVYECVSQISDDGGIVGIPVVDEMGDDDVLWLDPLTSVDLLTVDD